MQKTIQDITVFADGLDHPECVAVHPDGTVWAGGEAGQVYRIAADGSEITEVVNTGGFILGIAFSPGASWLAICDLKQHCIWKYEITKNKLSLFANHAGDHQLRIPNYPVFDKTGHLYVSDSGAFREVSGMIYKFDPSGAGHVWHAGPFNFANGMALSEDGRTLYVVCTWLPGVESIEIDADGRAGERKVIALLPQTCPDGIAIDSNGDLYISCYAPNTIFKITVEGEVTTLIHDWESHTLCNPTNIAFGGKEHKQLFVAGLGRWHIARLEMEIAGLPLSGCATAEASTPKRN